MNPRWRLVLVVVVGGCGGGGDGTTPPPPPPTVASVVITSPSAAPAFGTLGRTAQFAAEARDQSNAVVAATITWSSTNTSVATVSSTGLVTAVANGTAGIRATAGTVNSSTVTVTVSQVPAAVTITPSVVAFGAIGSTRQLSAAVTDSGGADIAGAVVTYARLGPGTSITVSATGLVTATANGTGDSAAATAGQVTAKRAVTVAQVPASVVVTSQSGGTPDTLKATGSTRQYSAVARDSSGVALAAAPAFTWSSSATGVATVSAGGGLVTAVADGNSSISAATGGVSGSRPIVVRRLAKTLTLTPSGTSITTAGGTLTFTGVAKDSVDVDIAIAWAARSPTGIATVSPASGTNTTATAVSNGTTYIVMTANDRRDSVQITVSNQPAPPVSFAGQVMPIFTTNCAKAGCHTGAAPTGGMNLSGTSSQVRARLVGVATVGGPPGSIRVIAGNADSSYIIRKLEGGPNILGGQMPADGPPFLPQSTINIIRNWITQGALDN